MSPDHPPSGSTWTCTTSFSGQSGAVIADSRHNVDSDAQASGSFKMTHLTLLELSRRLARGETTSRALGRREPRAHRRPGRRGRAGVSDGLCRAGPRRGRRRRRRSEERRGPAPFRRRSAVDQGPFRRRGRADARGIAPARRRARGARRRRDDRACAPRGLRYRRQDQHERIRLFGAWRERALWDAAQPLGSRARAYRRRLDFRRRGQRRRRNGARDAWHRHRRLVPHPGGLLRDRRLQADARPRVAERRLFAQPEPRFGRAAGAQRLLLRGSGQRLERRRARTKRPRRWPASRSE